MDDVAVLLEHVNLLDSLDGLNVHLLQGGLELLVVGAGRLVDSLGLAAGGTLASVTWKYPMSAKPVYNFIQSRCESCIGADRNGDAIKPRTLEYWNELNCAPGQ